MLSLGATSTLLILSGANMANAHPKHASEVIFVPMAGPVTDVKEALFKQLLHTSTVPIVVGFDHAQTADKVQSVIDLTLGAAAAIRTRLSLVAMSHDDLVHRHSPRFPQAIQNFAGSPPNAPSKLAALDWFARSNFSYMWHFEDDTYVHNFSELSASYAKPADLVIDAHNEKLPFWYPDWMVGDTNHGLPPGNFNFAGLAAFRTSRRFANAVLHTIQTEHSASHHEIFLPYVFSRHPHFVLQPLHGVHTKHLQLNFNRPKETWPPLCALEEKSAALAHPVKVLCPSPHNAQESSQSQ